MEAGALEWREFPELETPRLRLRPVTEQDAKPLFGIFGSEQVMRYYGRHPMIELMEAEEMIERFRLLYLELRGIRWGIEMKQEQRLIGTVGFHSWVHGFQRAELGYELETTAQGQGYATEALEAAISYGFGPMGLNRISALVYPDNDASARLLQRMGFRLEGLLEQYALFCERYEDLHMFGLVKQRWMAKCEDKQTG